MATDTKALDPALYLADEVAWLDAMSRLAAERRLDELDCEHLAEYLADMARRDRREVKHRLVQLLTHLLKWQHQPRRRSWRVSIMKQRWELSDVFRTSRTLELHALEIFADAYRIARRAAAAETGLPLATFPPEWPGTLDDALTRAEPADDESPAG